MNEINESSIKNSDPIYQTKNSELDNINQQITILLNFISKQLNHNLTLLVYTYDIDIEKPEKLNCFELSFDNYKYFSRTHSILLNEDFHSIAQFLSLETRKKQISNHLNSFIDINDISIQNEKQIIEIAQNLKSLYLYCSKLKTVENLSIYNYLQYSQNCSTILRLSE